MAAKENDLPAELRMTASEMRDRLATGALKAVEVAKATISHIEAKEPDVRAWTWFDPEFVMNQAEHLDKFRASGRAIGALHGVPVGIKDIIDTAKIPTENGSPIDAGRVPTTDAFVVERLKQAGAVIVGKTVTTELAFMDTGKTRNPNNLEHTPGGSSSGSAAAVAAGMVPLAIGSQTGGSVIRPASFCGVVGFKPTYGAIPRTGMLSQAPSLDTVGVFAQTVDDAALVAQNLFGFDQRDKATSLTPAQNLFDTARSAPPVKPTIAFVRQPAWNVADEDTQSAFKELTEFLGEDCLEVDLPTAFTEAMIGQRHIQLAELAKSYFGYARRGADKLGPKLTEALEKGNEVLARDYMAALDWSDILNAALDEIFDRFDAIITPAAPGAAPKGFENGGDPAFNGLWTMCGVPAVTIPLFEASNGLPMGVQVIGRRGDDGRVLRNARWLAQHVQQATS